MGCCSGIIKYLLFLFNVLFWIAGGAVLGIGIYLLVANNVQAVVQVAGIQFYYAGCYVLISVGCVMFLVGFFGCCGAIKENKCLLGTYFTCLLIIFLAQVGIGIWALVSQSSIETEIKKGLNSTLPLDYSKSDAYANTVVAVQQSFKCCGLVTGCTDWVGGNTTGCSCTPVITNSTLCAVPSSGTCINGDTPGGAIYTSDCYDAIIKFINDNIYLIAGIGLGIGLAEIFGMIFALIMCRSEKSGYETY
ncbi:CD81 antigen-like [Ciona intestinalis]